MISINFEEASNIVNQLRKSITTLGKEMDFTSLSRLLENNGITDLNAEFIYIFSDKEENDPITLEEVINTVQTVFHKNVTPDELFKLVFNKIDKDGSGEIDIDEFRRFLTIINGGYNSDSIFRFLDKDRNGTINYDEMYTYIKAKMM